MATEIEHLDKINKRTVVQMWSIIIWCAGALFWGGYAYDKFANMDKHLESIDVKMDKLADLDVVRARQVDDRKRIESLENEILKLESR